MKKSFTLTVGIASLTIDLVFSELVKLAIKLGFMYGEYKIANLLINKVINSMTTKLAD